jgi:hypothetical protein
MHRLVFSTSTGRTVSAGKNNTGETEAVMIFTADEPLVGFWGTDNTDSLQSLGGIAYKTNCTIGQVIYDPVL